jgi:SAM-dependent methyltransferase
LFELGPYEYFEDENLALLRHSPRGQRVLDVGCGSGLFGARLRERGNEVWGADSAQEVADTARQRLDRFLLADVTSPQAIAELEGERFETIVFADVLEHLHDPVAVVRAYLPFLTSRGTVMISVPNVAVWYIRLGLLAGRFNYSATGTLDRTHLRFFTRRNLLRLLREVGLQPEVLDVNPGIARAFVSLAKRMSPAAKQGDPRGLVDSKAYRLYRRWLHPVEYRLARALPGLLAFQYIAVAHQRS